MGKYEDLDERILSIIRATPMGCMAIAERTSRPRRIIDNRLQALRKRNLIVPNRKNGTWELATED